jgi:hypothetical protein
MEQVYAPFRLRTPFPTLSAIQRAPSAVTCRIPARWPAVNCLKN